MYLRGCVHSAVRGCRKGVRRRKNGRGMCGASVVGGSAGGQVIVVGDVRGAQLGEVMRQGVQPQGSRDILAAQVTTVQLTPGVRWCHVTWRPEDVPPQGASRPVIFRGRGVPHRTP